MLLNVKKTFTLLLFCISALTFGAKAQKPSYADTLAKLKTAPPAQRAQIQTDLMKSKLMLNDAQYKQVSAINLEYAKKIEPILRSDDNQFSKYGQISPLLEEKDGKLKPILTAEQFKKYEEVKKEMMAQAREANKSN
ncbi:MAG TPA: hypothetical protein VNS58_11810 [Puia sp.]|nr:hypothetical protein [Puia sp.]